MKVSNWMSISIGSLLIGASLLSGNIINTGERGVVTRFGALHGVQDEGLNFKIPLVDFVTKMTIRDQNLTHKFSTSSKDIQTVDIEVGLVYALDPKDVGKIYQSIGKRYEDILISPMLG